MCQEVLYLCWSEKSKGLVFAIELPKDYYTNGMFVIQGAPGAGKPASNYSFKAAIRSNFASTLISLDLRVEGKKAFVDHETHGKYTFDIKPLNGKYVGKSKIISSSHEPLFVLTFDKVSCKLAEETCVISPGNGFFFCGTSPDNI
jgi:hypothetical protein